MLPTGAVPLWVRKGVSGGPGRHQLLRKGVRNFSWDTAVLDPKAVCLSGQTISKWSSREARVD